MALFCDDVLGHIPLIRMAEYTKKEEISSLKSMIGLTYSIGSGGKTTIVYNNYTKKSMNPPSKISFDRRFFASMKDK